MPAVAPRVAVRPKKEFAPVPGAHIRVADASVIGRELERIAATQGKLNAEMVVEHAKVRTSPLHRFFEWNDQKASEEYRLVQARELIRSVRVVIVRQGEANIDARRAYVFIESQQMYQPISKVMSNADYRAEILATALRELREWKARYTNFCELAAVFAAIDAAIDKDGREGE